MFLPFCYQFYGKYENEGYIEGSVRWILFVIHFKTTYELDGDLYIVRGYGEQETGGYSICIRDLYLTSNAILFDTELVGPRKGEQVSSGPSYPYIVIKTEKRDESTIFE